jgi:hypothetical protein
VLGKPRLKSKHILLVLYQGRPKNLPNSLFFCEKYLHPGLAHHLRFFSIFQRLIWHSDGAICGSITSLLGRQGWRRENGAGYDLFWNRVAGSSNIYPRNRRSLPFFFVCFILFWFSVRTSTINFSPVLSSGWYKGSAVSFEGCLDRQDPGTT